jgi:hypothetical protein
MSGLAPAASDGPVSVAEWHGVDRARFEREVLPQQAPAVLRGLAADWPLVRQAQQGSDSLAALLKAHDLGTEVDALMLDPVWRGRIGFTADGRRFNFLRNRLPLSQVVSQLQRYARLPAAPAVAVQSALVDNCAPGLLQDLSMPLLDAAVRPRLWLGNAIHTPAHFDESANLACVVAGRRRFTLFPPEQVAHLYVGAIGHSPTGTPVSQVDVAQPDLVRHPHFVRALAQAQVADLGPGDVLYLPPLWWHHVASLDRLNLMLNYWWKPVPWSQGMDLLLHALLALKDLPAAQRQGWRALLDHWVFKAGPETLAHVPADLQGLHAPFDAERAAALRADLRRRLGD